MGKKRGHCQGNYLFSARALLVLCIEERQREVRAALKCTCGQMLGTSAGETRYPLPCFGIHIKGDLSRVTVAPQIGHISSSKREVYVIGPPGYDTNIICQDPFLGCDRSSCSCILGDLSQHGDKSPTPPVFAVRIYDSGRATTRSRGQEHLGRRAADSSRFIFNPGDEELAAQLTWLVRSRAPLPSHTMGKKKCDKATTLVR